MSSLVASFVDIARFEDHDQADGSPTRIHRIRELVLEVSASSLGRDVTISNRLQD